MRRLISEGSSCYTCGKTDHNQAITVLGSSSYTYDANGNMLTRNVPEGNFTLTHNADNRLVGTSGAASAQFIYNGDGARVVGIVNGVTSIYIGSYYEYQLPHSTHIFSDSFVSGNLWAWSTYPMDTDMQVTAAAALDGDNKGVAVGWHILTVVPPDPSYPIIDNPVPTQKNE